MRGEKGAAIRRLIHCIGSPPHARGKVTSFHGGFVCRGITPACAGKSAAPGGSVLRGEDHPRMRGEKRLSRVYKPATPGSPPHARGKV